MHILITGVSRGLGRSLTQEFVRLGHTVTGCARNPEAIAELSQRYGSPHRFDSVDVADDAQVKAWSQQVLADSVPDFLINNAGVINNPAPLWQIAAAEFDRVIDVNIKGPMNAIRHFVPAMVERQSGVIVNVSSGWGRSTSPEVGPYCATKWAIEGLSRALAQELPASMASVPLNPGIIHTEMLEICFGQQAQLYDSAQDWSHRAASYILQITPQDSGRPLAVS
ncbi:oxidoreductase [filamentous cyanobacterium CCP5]|nr:oxidoreductase [filamentous cyanobacterium CCP5]